MGTPWEVDDTAGTTAKTPWSVDDTKKVQGKAPWEVDDTQPKADTPGFLDHIGGLIQNVPMVGTVQDTMLPKDMGTQLAIGANQGLLNQPETFFRERVLDEEHRNTPENQARLAQLKGERGIAGGLIKEAQSGDNAVATKVGDALQSVPASAASLVGAAALPVAPAMALGLGTNMVLETAGDYTRRRDEFGQSPDQAEMPALAHGAVATALEAGPLGAATKYLRGVGASGAKTLAKVGVGEGVQEGATSLYDDLVTNYQGLTAYTPEDIAKHAGDAALTGMLMVPILGPAGKVIQMGRAHGEKKAQERLIAAAVELDQEAKGAARAAEETLRANMAAAVGLPAEQAPEPMAVRQQLNPLGEVAETPFVPTPEEEALAAIQKVQGGNGFVPPKDANAQAFAATMTEQLGQLTGYDPETENQMDNAFAQATEGGLLDTGGISPAVQARRNRDPALERTIPTAEQPILLAQDQRVVGLPLSAVGETPEGSVTWVGKAAMPGEEVEGATVHLPTAQALTEVLMPWVQEFMPKARILIESTKLPQDTFGLHRTVVGPTGNVTHVINLSDMANLISHGKSDEVTSLNLIGALSHEFGHALESQALFDGLEGKLAPELIGAFQLQAKRGQVAPAVLKALKQVAPAEAALVQEWQGLRKSILDGTMTAEEFMEKWAGLRKVGKSLKQDEHNQNLMRWAEEQLGGRIYGRTALELVSAMNRDASMTPAQQAKSNKKFFDEYLSLTEYMAEQHSRYAYTSGAVTEGAFGQIFQAMAAKLKALFVRFKTWKGGQGERIIAPGTSYAQWLESLTLRSKLDGWKNTPFELSEGLKRKQRKIVKDAGKKALEANKAKKEKKAVKELEKLLEPKKKVEGQVPVGVEEKTSQVEWKARLKGMAEELFVADHISEKMLDKYLDMIQRGDLLKAEKTLTGLVERYGMYDREYTSKVLQRLPNKEKIKAETLQATLKMQDIKATERAMWERFLAEHPNGFTPEEAREAVVANVIPLTPYFEGSYAHVGIHVLDGLTGLDPTSVVWEGPAYTGANNHFNNPNYVMHSRRADSRGERYVLELQSDLFQKFDNIFPEGAKGLTLEEEQATEELEHVQLLVNEINDSIAENDPKIYLDEGSLRSVGFAEDVAKTMMASQDQGYILQGLQAKQMELQAALGLIRQEQARRAQLGPVEQLQEMRSAWWERLIKEEIAEATVDGVSTIYFPSAEAVSSIEGWGEIPAGEAGMVRGIYARYKSVIPKYLKKNFNAVEVEFNGFTWYAVDPTVQGENIISYDRDNPYSSRDPQVVLDELAGLAPEEYRVPERVAEAQSFWNRLGTESPYFKRWFGKSMVVDEAGKPLLVWRGTGNPVAFLDKTTRGGLTGAPSARKAFWFSDNRTNAEYYAAQAISARQTVLKEELRRDAQSLRESLAAARELLGKDLAPEQRKIIEAVIRRDQNALTALEWNPDNKVPAAPTVREHYLRMENPLVVTGLAYGSKEWDQALADAAAGGFDGVIYKEAHDPFKGDVYAVFEPEQVKADSNMRTYDPTDNLHWDRDSPVQMGFKDASRMVQGVWTDAKLRGLNAVAWAQDQLIQLQQLAAGQPDDPTLQGFMRVKREAESLKNRLMGRAEDVTKGLISVTGSSAALRKQLHSVLRAEAKEGMLYGMLVGKDAYGEVVWGGELGDTGREQRALVSAWEVTDSLGLRNALQKQGVEVESENGKKLIKMYLDVRNVFMQEFYELGLALKVRADKAYGDKPLVRNVEFAEIDELTFKQVATPFLPVGNFGDWVIIVKRGKDTVKVQYFESQTAYDKAYKEALQLARGTKDNVKGKHLTEEEKGMVLRMPKDYLEKLAATEEFTDEQLELLQDVLQVAKYDKINERYEKISKQIDGANEDFSRVFADFTWHNSNYIWKMKYRSKFQDVLHGGRKEIREMEKRRDLPVELQTEVLKRLRRNQELMEHQKKYMLEPQDEFQNVRGYISLAYLAYGAKTALMNLSTNFNTMAAVTEEYGEGAGTRHYGKAVKNFWTVWKIAERRRNGDYVALTPEQEKDGLEPMVWAMGQALEEGIIDQSFAYYLAGQSNSNAFMRAVQRNNVSALASRALEFGMMPFQAVEKFNRIVALQTFMSAGVEENAKEGNWRSFKDVYEKATRRVDQTQNAYDSANRAKVLQGKKALLTMFMSYTLFQGHIMTGGLHRAVKADISAENRERAERGLPPKVMPNALRSSTTKLWLVYLLLSGGLGLPFAENILDLVRWLWKKLWPKEDAEVELRNFIQDMGMDSNLVLHGALHDVGGFDVSGSFGLGRLVPGTAFIGKNFKSKEEMAGAMAATVSGPAGSFLLAMTQAGMELGKGKLGGAGKAMPGAIGAVSKAIDAHVAQTNRPTFGVTTKSGQRLTLDPETGEFRDLTTTELVGMAMGFTPTMTKQNREVNYRITSEVLYWQIRRADLLDKYQKARLTGDLEGLRSVQEETQKFNGEVPSPKMRITGKVQATSLRAMRKGNALAEKYGTRSKGTRAVGGYVREGFGEGGESDGGQE